MAESFVNTWLTRSLLDHVPWTPAEKQNYRSPKDKIHREEGKQEERVKWWRRSQVGKEAKGRRWMPQVKPMIKLKKDPLVLFWYVYIKKMLYHGVNSLKCWLGENVCIAKGENPSVAWNKKNNKSTFHHQVWLVNDLQVQRPGSAIHFGARWETADWFQMKTQTFK